MFTKIWHIETNKLKEVDAKINLNSLDSNNIYWVEIRSNERDKVIDLLKEFNLKENTLELIREPELSNRAHFISNSLLFSLPLFDSQHLNEISYLTVITSKNFLLTIINEDNPTLEDVVLQIQNNPFELRLSLHLVMYYIISEVLSQGMEKHYSIRQQVLDLTRLGEDPDEDFPIEQITATTKEINNLVGITANQFYILGFIPTLDWKTIDESEQFRNAYKDLIQGFLFLERNLERQENRLETLHSQFQLNLQEKGNKRLSTLTIIQSIFIPLTLIAGIYGMNFNVIPELQWKNGYYILLLIMLLIAIIELIWFKRKGWFD